MSNYELTDEQYQLYKSNAIDKPPKNYPDTVATDRGWMDMENGVIEVPHDGLRTKINMYYRDYEKREKKVSKTSGSNDGKNEKSSKPEESNSSTEESTDSSETQNENNTGSGQSFESVNSSDTGKKSSGQATGQTSKKSGGGSKPSSTSGNSLN